jgi:hypothetical protein
VIAAIGVPPDARALLDRYYTPHAQRVIATRGRALPPQAVEGAPAAWDALHAAFRDRLHEPADSPAVQALAARMHALIEAFTGGDPEVAAGLQQVVAHAHELPPGQRPYPDAELHGFMQAAYAHYRRLHRLDEAGEDTP